jgi:hypothetical protein
MHPEIEFLEKMASLLPEGKTITFDMSLISKNWLLDYTYFFVPKTYTYEQLAKESCEKSSYDYELKHNTERNLSPRDFLEYKLGDSYKNDGDKNFSGGRIELLAWSKFTVEKDTGMFYLYDADDKCLGLFCHSMNWVKEFSYVGKSLSEFFDLELTLKQIQEIQTVDDFPACKRKLSKAQLLTFDKLLAKNANNGLESRGNETSAIVLYL